MKIGLIGGIYGAGGKRSGYVKSTPETTLEAGFRRAGHEVTTFSHYDAADFSRFDVVHVHHLSYGAVRLASDASATPFVYSAHDVSHMSGTRVSPMRSQATRYVMSRADAVVSLSEAEAEFVQRKYSVASARQATIPNGIDPSQFPFRRANAGGVGEPWRLLFVGQLIALKSCDLLLRAIARLEHPVTLTLAYQTATLEHSLRELAAELGLQDRVFFIGKQDPQALSALYQASDLLVLPSETEALPSVITEAMMSGLPFVASAVGGIPEQAGGFGRLVSQRTQEGLAADIAHVLDHYPEYSGAAERMSSYARKSFSVESMVARHLELYSAVQGASARRRSAWGVVPAAVVRAAVRRWGVPKSTSGATASAAAESI